MRLLPYRSYVIETKLPPSAAQARLSAVVEPKCRTRLAGEHLPFEGTVGDNSFTINQILSPRRNDFKPLITGEIGPTSAGSRITLRFHPEWDVVLFVAIWTAFALTLSTIWLTAKIAQDGNLLGPIAFLTLFAPFGYALLMLGFLSEIGDARRQIAKVLE